MGEKFKNTLPILALTGILYGCSDNGKKEVTEQANSQQSESIDCTPPVFNPMPGIQSNNRKNMAQLCPQAIIFEAPEITLKDLGQAGSKTPKIHTTGMPMQHNNNKGENN